MKKKIEEILFKIYEKGLEREDCNLTYYYKRIMKLLNQKKKK